MAVVLCNPALAGEARSALSRLLGSTRYSPASWLGRGRVMGLHTCHKHSIPWCRLGSSWLRLPPIALQLALRAAS